MIDRKDGENWTALHFAVNHQQCATTRLLIKLANLKATTQKKWTPLHHAARYCCLECVKLIVSKEESLLRVKNDDGASILHLAACNSKIEKIFCG